MILFYNIFYSAKHRSHFLYTFAEVEFVFDLSCRDDCSFTFISVSINYIETPVYLLIVKQSN